MCSAWNILASLGLWWWQHIIVRDLYEHCIAAEYIWCRKTILIPKISYVHQILTSLSNCVGHNFLSKSRFLWKSTRLRLRGLTVLQYIHPACFSSHAQLHVASSRSSSCDSVAVTLLAVPWHTESDQLTTSNVYVKMCFKVPNIFNQQIYFIIWYFLDRASLI